MKEQKIYWNEFIMDWDKSVYNQKKENLGWVEKIATHFRGILVFRMQYALDCLKDQVKDKTILEIGCGTGRFALELYKLGASKVYGIDISDLAIEEAKKNFKNFGIPEDKYHFESVDLKDFHLEINLEDTIVVGLGILQYLQYSELKRLFEQLIGADYFFEFHENKFSLTEIYHTIYRNLKSNLPYYHKLNKQEIRELLDHKVYPQIYYDRIKKVSYFTTIDLNRKWKII